jgi:type IV pilus assembly protein PilW
MKAPVLSGSASLRLAARSGERGLSLVELMVSIAIGLVVTIAVMSAYLGSSQASKVSDAQARMNEDANLALAVLTQHLRMAGTNPRQVNYMNDPPSNPVFNTTTYVVRGCDGAFGNITSPLDPTALTCVGSSATVPDSIVVRYEADIYNTERTTGGVATDCLGSGLTTQNATVPVWNTGTNTSVNTAITYTVANNLFYIASPAGSTVPSLYCLGNGNATGQPLVENIEDMQVIYGTAAANASPTLSVAGYLSATALEADANLAALPDNQERWGKVLTVRICIVVRSEDAAAPDADSAAYVQCDGTLSASQADRRLRKAYTTTVAVRNRMTP